MFLIPIRVYTAPERSKRTPETAQPGVISGCSGSWPSGMVALKRSMLLSSSERPEGVGATDALSEALVAEPLGDAEAVSSSSLDPLVVVAATSPVWEARCVGEGEGESDGEASCGPSCCRGSKSKTRDATTWKRRTRHKKANRRFPLDIMTNSGFGERGVFVQVGYSPRGWRGRRDVASGGGGIKAKAYSTVAGAAGLAKMLDSEAREVKRR